MWAIAVYYSIVDLIFGFEQPSYTFSESAGTGNIGVRLSPESGEFSENFVFTFSTGDVSAVGEYDDGSKILWKVPAQFSLCKCYLV